MQTMLTIAVAVLTLNFFACTVKRPQECVEAANLLTDFAIGACKLADQVRVNSAELSADQTRFAYEACHQAQRNAAEVGPDLWDADQCQMIVGRKEGRLSVLSLLFQLAICKETCPLVGR